MNARQFFDVWPLVVHAAGLCRWSAASSPEHQRAVYGLRQEATLLHDSAVATEAVRKLRALLDGDLGR